MELKQYIKDSLERNRARTLDIIKDLKPDEIIWQPGPQANHIAFLLWHMARSEDGLFNRWIMGREQVWVQNGWDKKFRLGPEDSGGGWTPQQVADFRPMSLDQIVSYMAEVRASLMEGLDKLDMDRLEERPRPDRPDWTIATMLQLLAVHEAHHQGAIEYLKGLKRSGTY